MGENRRIAKNTIFLYFRMMLVMFVGLFTSRITLRVLGVEDFGLQNVVGGIVAMLGFLNSCAAGATSRFLTFALGQSNNFTTNFQEKYDYRETFSAAFVIHVAIAIVIVFLAETIGLWYLENKLVVPEGREYAAMWMYQLSVISILITFTQVPYAASIIAHERMNIYAYMGVVDAGLKLLNAYLLMIAPFDKLIFISSWTFLQTTAMAIFYRVYCVRKFGETCKLKVVLKKDLYKRLLSYSGWDLIGNFGGVARSQGVNLMLNFFFGPTVNAARGVVSSVENALESFTNNFLTAVRPALIKNYAAGNITRMLNMTYESAKFSSLLYAGLAMPLIIDSNQVLRLWLGTPPEHSPIFLRIVLFNFIWVQINKCLIMAVHATGDVKRLNIIAGSKIFLDLPIIYILLKLGFPAYSALLVFVVGAFIVMLLDGYVLKLNEPKFKMSDFIVKVLLTVICILVVPSVCAIMVHKSIIAPDFMHLIIVCAAFWCLLLPFVYFFALPEAIKARVQMKFSKYQLSFAKN